MNVKLQENARTLRKSSTDAENKMWYFIRNRRLNGHKFIRQYVIEPYIVDFICRDKQLIVELDGSQHLEETMIYDLDRTQYLESRGYKVLRFWNNQVMHEMDQVLEMMLQFL